MSVAQPGAAGPVGGHQRTSFRCELAPMRVVFGPGALDQIGAELEELGASRVLTVSSPGRVALAERVAGLLGARSVGTHPEAVEHVPTPVADAAVERARTLGADACLAVGGGSAIGLAKMLARDLAIPVVAVPTTYAGSEMTAVWGQTDAAGKRTGVDERVRPALVIYDPALTLDLPARVSAASGMNALAHAVEALYAPDASPVTDLFAREGVAALTSALPSLVSGEPDDQVARSTALYGAWLCGACLGATTMGLQHKLAHVLGGTSGLPHAPAHAVVLPHVLAYNAGYAPATITALAQVLDTPEPAHALWELTHALGLPRSLGELGFATTDIDTVSAQVVARPYPNPRPVAAADVADLLRRAWAGEPPAE